MTERRGGAVTSLPWIREGVGGIEAPPYGKEGLGWLRKKILFYSKFFLLYLYFLKCLAALLISHLNGVTGLTTVDC